MSALTGTRINEKKERPSLYSGIDVFSVNTVKGRLGYSSETLKGQRK